MSNHFLISNRVLKFLIVGLLEFLIVREYDFFCRFHGYVKVGKLSKNYPNLRTIKVNELSKSGDYPSRRIIQVGGLSQGANYTSQRSISRIIIVRELCNWQIIVA